MVDPLYVKLAYELVDFMIRATANAALNSGISESEFEKLSKELDEVRAKMYITISLLQTDNDDN